MRRLTLAAMSALLVLSFVTPSLAGWGHVFRHHWHHIPHVRHYASHWVHRPYLGHHHYTYRSFRYVPRYYHHAPVRYYYHAPVRFYSYPHCVSSVTPSYSLHYDTYSSVDRAPTPLMAKAEPRPAPPASSWIKLAERLISEVAVSRDDPELVFVSRTPGEAGKEDARETFTDPKRILELGDELFRAERYEQARETYESATRLSRTLAAAHFRHAQACIATGRYDQAVGAVKRGLAADPTLLRSGFRLQDVYGDEREITRHVEALAAAALTAKDDADLLFLIGTFLHFEGQPARAEKFFERATELAGDDTEHISKFVRAGRRSAPLRLSSAFADWSETGDPF